MPADKEQEPIEGLEACRVKFVGMSMDSLENPPEIDDEMTFLVHTRCVGSGRQRMKDGELRLTRSMEVLTLEAQDAPSKPSAGPNLFSVDDGEDH
ncbi:MAG: hypothetical protein ACREN2_12660 [Candidatus Dormibacteria bacterium]